MANTIGEKELKTSWPFTKGLIAETTIQEDTVLLPDEESQITAEQKKGIR